MLIVTMNSSKQHMNKIDLSFLQFSNLIKLLFKISANHFHNQFRQNMLLDELVCEQKIPAGYMSIL